LAIPVLVAVIAAGISFSVSRAGGHANEVVPRVENSNAVLTASALPKTVDETPITATTVSPDGTMIVATASGDLEFRNIDGALAASNAVVHLSNAPIIAAATSHDGSTWAAATLQAVFVGTRSTPATQVKINPFGSSPDQLIDIGSVALDPTGKMLAVGLDPGERGIMLIDAQTAAPIANLEQPCCAEGPRGAYRTLAYSYDGSTLFASDGIKSDFWDARSQMLKRSVTCPCSWDGRGSQMSGGVGGNAFSSSAMDSTVTRQVTVSTAKNDGVIATASDGESELFALTRSGTLTVWSKSNVSPSAHLQLGDTFDEGYLQLSPDKSYLLLGATNSSTAQFIEGARKYQYRVLIVRLPPQ
jgi:hypothetical protein